MRYHAPMNDQKLAEAMRVIGIDASNVALVSLLPLVQVAWADGTIQPAERRLIVGLAEKHGLLKDGGAEVVEQWLSEAPSEFVHATARKVFQHLLIRADLPPPIDREGVVGWCWALAGAAGGLFGTRFMAIDGAEHKALDTIAAALGVEEVPDDWMDLTITD